jgi:hypothetical protein
MTLADTEQRLLQLVEQWRDEECRALMERAQTEARELLRNSRRRARRQVHETYVAEHERARERLAAARAELATRRHRRQRQLGEVILGAGRQQLAERLTARWGEPDRRTRWIRSAVADAQVRLPAGHWTVRHGADFRTEDHNTLLASIGSSRPPALVADHRVGAGLVIECAGVQLDASAAGLLADREAIEGRLLALMQLEPTP